MTTSRSRRYPVLFLAAAMAGATGAGFAQALLKLPQASPAAAVSQTVGLTEIQVDYHRPAVNGRKIWGGLVPYNEIWRAGANENTTIKFSTRVTVEGKKLAPGTYGLHMIPGEKEWTIVFSNMSAAWGSRSYDPKEDAARVTASPRPADFEERLSYRLDGPTDTSVEASMRWEKLAVPFRIEVDTPAVVVESLRSQLRGLPVFSWQGFSQAAAYCAEHGVDLPEALTWVDQSISMNENFQNLRVKAAILEKSGDAKAAESLRAQAMKIATETDLNNYGYQLMAQQKMDEAIAIFQRNTREHPQSWNVWDSLAKAYERQGNKKAAIDNYTKALSMAPAAQKKRIEDTLSRLKT
jgi:tetratricopeptide (TPR) repeat protein